MSEFNIPDALEVREFAPGAPVIIAFTSVNSNGFSFYKNLEKLPFSRIYVRDPFDCWFQRGIGSGVDSPEALVAYLGRVLAELRPLRRVTMGSSMGGYAALLFGHLLRVDAVFAMSPQTIIDRRLPHTPSEDFSDRPYFDLAPLLRIKNRHRPATHILFGSDDIVDVWNATRVVTLPGDVQYPVAGRDHLASNLIAGNGDLAVALSGLARDEAFTLTAALDRRCEAPRVKAILDRLTRALYLAEPDLAPEEWTERLQRLEPDWAVPYDVAAMLATRRGDVAAAEAAAGKAAELAPLSITLQTSHAQLLMRLGREAEAIAAFERCLKIRPKHYAALCALGILRARAGDYERALAHLDTAIAIRPRLARGKSLRAAVLEGRAVAISSLEEPGEDM
ncbi:tetratricopeptide repeat protein [Roseomonas frigidaquae]|uniref:Tetratricopeptide repeat protein n=1 Tax=Falsiroseomonas frigidaquae TaxID=487318 RepID=A0ABX1F8D7_9PROT|nr:tetratricopeptide repeat protein [Falsiroseomonas frigidaquae]NKE48648.1 tetratricopeptide repeat protein [Falsiroseomonas frigidaquae]